MPPVVVSSQLSVPFGCKAKNLLKGGDHIEVLLPTKIVPSDPIVGELTPAGPIEYSHATLPFVPKQKIFCSVVTYTVPLLAIAGQPRMGAPKIHSYSKSPGTAWRRIPMAGSLKA